MNDVRCRIACHMRSTALLLLLATPALAQRAVPITVRESSAAVPTLATERVNGAMHIDGRLDEPAWKTAPASDAFTQSYPTPGKWPSERTEVSVLYDNDAIYIGVRMYDAHPDSIAAQLARRDVLGAYSDWIHVAIDSYHDRRTAFHFAVNPLGVKYDALDYNDKKENSSWDAVWDVATRVDSVGWTAEFSIPLSQLRFSSRKSGSDRAWGFQVQRDIARYHERDSWSPWTEQSPGNVSSFGTLDGLLGVRTPRQLELVPYVSTKLTQAPGNGANPFYQPNDASASAGVDIKYGLPAGLTLAATINPDFGQAEVDPAVVNLTAFETLFPEKRSFFLEGSDAFQYGQINDQVGLEGQYAFYSRRIGRPPQRAVSGTDVLYVDSPDETSILGAAKITGKTRGWTIGVLDAVTGKESADYLTTSNIRGTTAVEPLTNYAVGRARHGFGDGNSYVGGIITATNRDMSDPVFSNLLHSHAFMGGLDFEHAWSHRAWILRGYAAASRIDGSPAAIAATQQSSAHYFQRPDAGYLTFDPTRTSLTGHLGEFMLEKTGTWFGSLGYKESDPGFEINDLGYQTRTDYRIADMTFGYRSNIPGRLFRNYSIAGGVVGQWNFGGAPLYELVTAGYNATFNNLWGAGVQLYYNPSVMSDRLTRGGPLARVPEQLETKINLNTDSRKPVMLSGTLDLFNHDDGGYAHNASLSVSMRPSTALNLSLGPSLSNIHSTNQYVLSVADPLATSTYGQRYVFANLSQTTLAMNIRLDWTFTTALSLQLYAQPLLATGKYTNFKELLTPATSDFGVYGHGTGTIARDTMGVYTADPDGAGAAPSFSFGDPTFNLRSLRGDAVLRWEYRPGSTLFFVWQQQRSGVAPLGDFDFGRDADAIFDTPITNVFLVKATFWIGR